MHKRLIVLLGVFLGSHAAAVAQTPPPQIVLAQERIVPAMTMLRTESTPLSTTSFLPYQDPEKSPPYFSHLFAGPNECDHSIERPLPMEEVKILFFTQSNLPLVQFWGGRLQLEVFQSTLHIENVQLGPLGHRGAQRYGSPRQSYPGGSRSVHLSGLTVSLHFGRDARTGRPTQAWQCLSRIVGTVLN